VTDGILSMESQTLAFLQFCLVHLTFTTDILANGLHLTLNLL
jgi:hypothetical protein